MRAIRNSLLLGIGFVGLSARGQLAITEIMSSAATNLGPAVIAQNADFWELTNFGTNAVDLTGYKWNDNQGGLIGGDPLPFTGLTIGPGESVLFFQSTTGVSTNAEQFRQWWGLDTNVQAVVFQGNGLSSTGDGIRLWSPSAAGDADYLDSVDFLEALRGATFVYNAATGAFDQFSTNAVRGAFKAVTADDVGSPGTTTGPVPLAIARQPTNTSVNPGDTAVFSINFSGLPRPRFQWFFNDQPIPDARFATLNVANVQAEKLGTYRVELDNGVQLVASSNANLTLNAAPEPPIWATVPRRQSVFIGQPFSLVVLASGVPQPAYHWTQNSSNDLGVTTGNYLVSSAQLSDAGTYQVVASNSLGTVTSSVEVVVTRRPRLVITEILPAQSTNPPAGGHNDWWELTNLDDFTVDLTGYRFDDSSATLLAAVTLTNQLSLAPGESIVFVENATPDEFREWWGRGHNLTNLQIITYRGAGLSLSSLGDAINLWNSGAVQDFDTVASEVFSTATPGISFRFDPDSGVFGDLSVEGFDGAVRAAESGDIGSPGLTKNPPEPLILRAERQDSGLALTWTTQTNRSYTVERASAFGATNWHSVVTLPALGPFLSYTNTMGNAEVELIRIKLEP